MGFAQWLRMPARPFLVVLLIFIFKPFLSLGTFEVMRIIGVEFSSFTNNIWASSSPSIGFVGYYAEAALFEEMIFRMLPIGLVVWLFGRRYPFVVLLTAILSSVVFGYLHGGVPYIFVQGVGGFIYSCEYLKCGGYQKKRYTGLFCSSVSHFLYNLSIIGIFQII